MEILWVLIVMLSHGQKAVASFEQQADCENFIAAFQKAREKPPEMRCEGVPKDQVNSPRAQ